MNVLQQYRSCRWMVVGVAVLAGCAAGSARAAAAEVLPVLAAAEVAKPVAAQERQVADEITRRLRRMGINIIRTRMDHPYDPEGEVC
jgi:hypothetical protein